MCKTKPEHSLIDDHFEIYNARQTKPSEKLNVLTPFLETIPEEFDTALFDYIDEIQTDAYHAGFAMAMQLAAECYYECRKIIPNK